MNPVGSGVAAVPAPGGLTSPNDSSSDAGAAPARAPGRAPTPTPAEIPIVKSTEAPATSASDEPSCPPAIARQAAGSTPTRAASSAALSPPSASVVRTPAENPRLRLPPPTAPSPACPGRSALPLRIAPGPTRRNSKSLCCSQIDRLIFARSGTPLSENSSRSRVMLSTIPASMNCPHSNRTLGGSSCGPGVRSICSIGLVLSRTDFGAAVVPSSAVSKTSSTLNVADPVPRYWARG